MISDIYKVPKRKQRNWAPLLASTGLKRVLKRDHRSRGLMIFPDIYSDSPVTLKFLERLADRLTSTFPLDVREDGVAGGSAIVGTFYHLRTVAGYGMNPLSTPPVDNTPIRQKLGLQDKFASDRHHKIYVELIRVMHENPLPASVPIRREATTCAPDYVKSEVKKKHDLLHALQNLEDFWALIATDNLAGLYTDFNAPIVHTIFERKQADTVQVKDGEFVTKEREVNDNLAAHTAFREGRRFVADKTVVINGNRIAGHFGQRRRTVFGMAFVPNYVVAAHYASFRKWYLNEYEFTWKHRTPASILEKMRTYRFMAGFDVSQFDQSVPRFLIDEYVTEMQKYVRPELAKLIGLMFKAPYIMPNPYLGVPPEDLDPLFGDDPFDIGSFDHNLGLPSGIACNPDFGKLQMTFAYLALLDDFFGDVLEVGLERILRGEHPRYAMLNMSDDCVILTDSERFHKAIVAGNLGSPYYKLGPENPISFLGNVPYHSAAGTLELTPNLLSFFGNWFVPEHGTDSRMRRDFWAIGDRERRVHYSQAPAYSDAFKIYEEEFKTAFGIYPTSISSAYYEEQKRYSHLSFTDQQVLTRPDLLLYRVDEKDVSPGVLDIIQMSLPADDVWQYTSSSFRSA